MSVATPDWLKQRLGDFRQGTGATQATWFVVFDRQPEYRLTPVPAGGKFSCHVVQTRNGKRLDKGGVFPSEEDAVRGGLEDLRKALGW